MKSVFKHVGIWILEFLWDLKFGFWNFSHFLRQSFLGFLSFLSISFLASTLSAAVPLNDPAAAQELAKKLAAAAPETNMAFRGIFELDRGRDEDIVIPVVSTVTLTNDGWRVLYTAQTSAGPESLAILHRLGKPSVYTHEMPRRDPISIVGDRATNTFAGTDFALLDLGLEFFNWPAQVLINKEMKKGRGCYVLESRPASPSFYSRVVSWLDEESSDAGAPGVVMAEAYDAAGKLWKQFEVRHVKKVAGQTQVDDMELRNRHSKGSTRLRFEFNSQ